MVQAKQSSGYDCGAASDCFQADGSGYSVPNIYHTTLAYHAAESAPWGLTPSLNWLARTAAVHSGSGVLAPPGAAAPPYLEPPSPPRYVHKAASSRSPKDSPPPLLSCQTVASQPAFLQHCGSDPDCTSDDDFCACCRKYGRQTEWSEACVAFCGEGAITLPPARLRWITQESSWRMDDFGRSQLPADEPPPSDAAPNTATGPYFEQPALSLVGDAAIVLGDCYELELRSSQMLDRAGNMVGTEACLLPPVTRKLFDSDSHLHLNLGVCPSALAPFHVHDTQPGAVAAMLCFDECHVRNHSTPTPLQPEMAHGALFIANCTRRCFTSCVRPVATSCAADCASNNYSCFGECHMRAESCSIPVNLRSTRTFRLDPNILLCNNHYQPYETCVRGCTEGCHDELRLSRRTVHDDINEWYTASCNPPLDYGATLAVSCLAACQENCTDACNRTVIQPLGPQYGLGPSLSNCTRECNRDCNQECFAPGAVHEYELSCRPPPPYNCSTNCFGGMCVAQVTFCSVYDSVGDLRHVDLNCTHSANVTYQPQWGNVSAHVLLSQPSSALSLYVGVNASYHICYNRCLNVTSAVGDLFFSGSDLLPSRNCSTTCYVRECVNECLDNCTAEWDYSILPACPRELAGTSQCLTPANCSYREQWLNCSSHKAFEPLIINISAVTDNVTVWVPAWDVETCENLVDATIGALQACTTSCPERCEELCPLPSNVTIRGGFVVVTGEVDPELFRRIDSNQQLVNDTTGVCLQECYINCTASCSEETTADVSSVWCDVPSEPIDWCTPPPNCTADCSHECLDPTYLLATDLECEEFMYRLNPDGSNISTVSLPYAFNISEPPTCSRNVSEVGGYCTEELLFYNVTEHRRNTYVSERCIRQCFHGCVARCFERYCVTRLEEPVNDTAVCLPRCLNRFYEAQAEDQLDDSWGFGGERAPGSEGGDVNGTACWRERCYANVTSCQLACEAGCLVMSSANCSSLCDHRVSPSAWQDCLAGCIFNTSAVCARDCVYACTSNHTLAYGFSAPYDASDDYSFEDVHAAAESIDAHLSSLGPWSYIWSNASRDCHENCTRHCAHACFFEHVDACEDDEVAARERRISLGLPPAHPRDVAIAHNNCTLMSSVECIGHCRYGCVHSCANITAEVPANLLMDQHRAH
jgi:hypothetical protein